MRSRLVRPIERSWSTSRRLLFHEVSWMHDQSRTRDALVSRTAAAGVRPPGTLLGVARLAFPELMVELEATAVA